MQYKGIEPLCFKCAKNVKHQRSVEKTCVQKGSKHKGWGAAQGNYQSQVWVFFLVFGGAKNKKEEEKGATE